MIEWKDVVGYEGLYMVSNHGDVKSLERSVDNRWGTSTIRKGTVLKGDELKGYLHVVLARDGNKSKRRVHRLVAESFLGNPENLSEVNHKDEVKSNNIVTNLEWCNRQYNSEYSSAKHWEVLTPDGFLIEVFNMKKFCRENNLNAGAMGKVAHGKQTNHHGYVVFKIEDKQIEERK